MPPTTRDLGSSGRQSAVPAEVSPDDGLERPVGRPGPVADRESSPFWDGLREHRIVVQACTACGRHRFPRMPSCPYCGAAGGTDVVVPGTGTVYSWVRAHRHLSGAGSGRLPYAVVTVALDTGPRLVGRLDPPDRAVIGLAVHPLFVDHPGDPGWTELRFRPDTADVR